MRLLDQFVGECEERWRHSQAKHPRGLGIDDRSNLDDERNRKESNVLSR
jgi:hypothetical protein